MLKRAALTILLAGAPTLSAQTAAELLQKGIYTQETVGDLDAAIRIYQRVVSLGTDARSQAAQAQYRLGLCLLRKGATNEATQAFEKLISDYPEQKDLVASARQNMPAGLKLLPTPWSEGESLILTMKLPTGKAIGKFVHTIERSSGGSFVLTTRVQTPGANQYSRAEAELETLKPKSSSFRHTLLGDYKLTYDGHQARILASDKEQKPAELGAATFDNETALALFRRLPLQDGYKERVEFLSPLGVKLPINLEVVASEELTTAAGKFQTFKLDVQPIRQTFWISKDSHRYLVKMEVNGVTGELEEITRVATAPQTFHEPIHNASLTLPASWLTMRLSEGAGEVITALFDGEAKCNCILWTGSFDKDLRADLDDKIKHRPDNLKNYKVREDSWTPKQVNGYEALSFIADFESANQPWVEYLTLMKHGGKGLLLFARVPASQLAAFRPEFDKVVQSARLP